MFSNEEDGVNM
jgi:hypothetical protein